MNRFHSHLKQRLSVSRLLSQSPINGEGNGKQHDRFSDELDHEFAKKRSEGNFDSLLIQKELINQENIGKQNKVLQVAEEEPKNRIKKSFSALSRKTRNLFITIREKSLIVTSKIKGFFVLHKEVIILTLFVGGTILVFILVGKKVILLPISKINIK
jgi:hypothetical protein